MDLRVELNINLTASHVKNQIKSWKKHYTVINEIQTYTKVRWDEERKMLIIPIEELEEWKTYCKLATGDGAEQHEESAIATEMENEVGSGPETVYVESNKRIKRNRLDDAITRFVESFNEYMSKAQGPPL
ncbi:hypothetical protein OROMI_033583 [Orobanche minor]